MDISTELKQRFCQDCAIPIDIFTEPIFASRIELYDRFYNTIERYNLFLKMIQEKYTTYDMESSATVMGVRKGTCSIRAYSSANPDADDSCTVKVTDDSDKNTVDSIYIEAEEFYIAIGAKRYIDVHVVPETVDNTKITWSTSDKRVAIAVGNLITAVGKGECTLTAISDKDKTKSLSCTVKVTDPVEVESINFVYHQTQIAVGGKEKLQLKSLPVEATDPDIRWSSSDPSVASVDNSGNIVGKKKGSCVITARSKESTSLVDRCYVLVDNAVKVSKIELNKYSLDMMVGGVIKLLYTVEPEKSTDTSVSWYSNNPKIVSVDTETGEITALGRGTATITASSNSDPSRKAKCIVNVVPSLNVRSVTLDTHSKETKVNEDFQISAVISVGYNVDPTIVWHSSNGRVASVEAKDSEPTLKETRIHAQDYYNDYDEVKCRLVKQIKYSSGYAKFNSVNTDSAWPITCTCVRSSIYTPDMDGHTMIGVKIHKNWFTQLYHYDPTIFKNLSAWENFVSTVGETDVNHIIYSENLLKEVMECCNISRVETYGQYIMNQFYATHVKPLISALGKDPDDNQPFAELVYFDKDEFVIDVSKLAAIEDLDTSEAVLYTNRMIKLYNDIKQKTAGYTCPHTQSPNRQPFPMDVRLFTLYKIKTEHTEDEKTIISADQIDGYVENIYYTPNQPIEFISADPCQLPMLMRTMSYESLQEHDRKFMHKGLIAEFTDDYKIHVPPISSIPDRPVEKEDTED